MTPPKLHNPMRAAFTLVELLVVVTLMTLAVGLTVFRLDSLSENGRLQSATRQAESILRFSACQARTTGEPRLVVFDRESDRFRLKAPAQEEGRWHWDEGRLFQTNSGAQFTRLMFEGGANQQQEESAIRVGGQGRYPACGVIFELHGRYSVFLTDQDGSEHRILDAQPQARDLAAIRLELEGGN